jgi:transposase
MARTALPDRHWERVCEAKARFDAYKTECLCTAIEGILCRHRTGAPWRDLSAEFGPWKTIYSRFKEWSKNGVWATLFESIKGNHAADNEWHFMDGTYVKAHQHAASGIEPVEDKTIGPSRGGNTTKVHMLGDTHGNPITFEITGANIHDVTKGEALLSMSHAESIIADKGYVGSKFKHN